MHEHLMSPRLMFHLAINRLFAFMGAVVVGWAAMPVTDNPCNIGDVPIINSCQAISGHPTPPACTPDQYRKKSECVLSAGERAATRCLELF